MDILETSNKTGESSYEKNIFRDIILEYLLTKDDNLILMTTTLIQKIITNNKISNKILQHCGLLTYERDNVLFRNNDINFENIQHI